MTEKKQKQALIFAIKDSAFFEEAHFVMKENVKAPGESEMVKEANRIIAAYENEQKASGKSRVRKSRTPLFYFISGGIFSSVFFALAGILIKIV